MSPPSGNPSWIERGWSLWIDTILRLPRTVLLSVALIAAAGGAYVLSGHPASASALALLGLPGAESDASSEPAFEREIVLRAWLRDGYESAELSDAANEAARTLARQRDLFCDVEIRFATPPPAEPRSEPSDSGQAASAPLPIPGGVSADAIRRAEDRLAFWGALPVDSEGQVAPAELWRTLSREGERSTMHALEADGLLFAAAQRVSRSDDGSSEPEANARLHETFDAFWSLSTAIAPEASEARVFARLAPEAGDSRHAREAAKALAEGLDAVRMRWPSVAWTISGPGYARVLDATSPSGPTWWDFVTLLAAAALAASAAGDLRRFCVAATAAIVSGGAAYALAWSSDFGGLVAPATLALALAVWTALVATLLLGTLATALEAETSLVRALAASLSGVGTAALVPLAVATAAYGVAASGDVPGAASLFRVVGAWSLFSVALWTGFFPAMLFVLARRSAWRTSAGSDRRRPRRPGSPGMTSPIGALTVAATLFVAWGALHLRTGVDTGPLAESSPHSRAAGAADRRFALFRASSPQELALARSRFAGLEAVDATAAGSDGRTDAASPEGVRLRRLAATAKALAPSVALTERPDWAAFTDELRNETSEDSPASTPQRRRMAQAALERTARMRPADVDRALGRCFEAWLERRDREVAALAEFGAQTASFADAGGSREADRFYAADGSPLLWIFPRPGVSPTQFVAELRRTGAEIGGPAVAAANRSNQRRQLALQACVFFVAVAAAALMIVLQSLQDVTSVLWAGGCSLAQTVGIAGWLGIPWYEEWIAAAPLAASAWIATALAHRLVGRRGGEDVWTGAPFVTLAASVAAMAVALRWIGAGDEVSAAAASWWTVALAAGWWNGWAYCSRTTAREEISARELEQEESTREGTFDFVEAPTHALPRPRSRRVDTAGRPPAPFVAEAASFAEADVLTESLALAVARDVGRGTENVLEPPSAREPAEPLAESRRAIERFDADGEAVPHRRSPRSVRNAVLPRRRGLSREEPPPQASADDDAWS